MNSSPQRMCRALLHSLCVATCLGLPAVSLSQKALIQNIQDLPEREEMNQSFQLAPGARVEVSVISGSLDVQTTAGNTAEVHIVRSARTREELDCYSIAIDHSATSLVVRRRQDRTGPCQNIRARQRVEMILPRDVDLKLDAISGPVHVAELDGKVTMSGLSGRVELEQGSGFSNIWGISGDLIVHVSGLGQRGMTVSGISGRVEFVIAGDARANLTINGLSGGVGVTSPAVSVSKVTESNFRGQIGPGGPPITISAISGTLAFRTDK